MSKPKSPAAEPDKKLEELRDKHLNEAETFAKKQRFALFSFPPPLCIGENSENKKIIPEREENGKIKTMSRNIQVSHSKAGKIKSSYFSNLSYITIDDKYFDPERLDRLKKLEEKKKMSTDKGVFKPASYYKTLVKPSFKHESDFKIVKKNFRDEAGKVIVPPKNITTGPEYKPLYKGYGHVPDEYERERALTKEERQRHTELIKDHPPFRNMERGDRPFVKDSKTYGLDKPLPQRSPKKELNLNIIKHDAAFRPSNPAKKGYNKTIAPFPKYEGNPIKTLQRIDLAKGKEAFKTCHSGNLTRPTPSITSHPINIRREIISTSNLLK